MRLGSPALLMILAVGLASASSAQASDVLDALTRPGQPGRVIEGVRPRQAMGGYVAKVMYRVPARSRAGGGSRVWTVGRASLYARNAQQLLVLAARHDADGLPWLKVQLPIRPNGAAGWIPADATLVRRTKWFVRLRVRPRTLSVYRAGRLARRVRAVVGADATPTPRGLFALYEFAPRADPNDFLGPWALHLTAFSNVLTNYGGGPGRVAIHGRGPRSRAEAPLGSAASHGCVRIDNAPIRWMAAHLIPGTPVRIASD